MRNRGFRNPVLFFAVCASVSVISWVAVAWGAVTMAVTGVETAGPSAAVGLGFAPAIIATGMTLLGWKGLKTVAATQRGEGMIARWTVSAEEYADFLRNNAARNALGPGYDNDWQPPREIPEKGLDVVVRADGVMVGDAYFGLVNTGALKFEGVQMLPENPLAIEFGTVATSFTQGSSSFHTRRVRGVLRLPVSRLGRDEGVKVLKHYRQVDAREIVVNPGFYLGRIRFGLAAATICFVIAALGFAIEFSPWGDGWENWTLPMAVVGIVAGIGGLVLARIASQLRQAQLRKR